MVKAMRATPKLTYPFELRARFSLFAMLPIKMSRTVAVPVRYTHGCRIRVILGTSNKLEYTQLLIEL
ncbi:hypothetical protein G6M84_20760 [Agrobacterium tumefaciens]|nr:MULTISPECIES: hypothetical protein [Agrobacterium]NTB98918.1 hypothetical protein [Agrobacterium tumefaciens]NTC45557.1 hypothetical protein [Agrobacterium tumefaciens]